MIETKRVTLSTFDSEGCEEFRIGLKFNEPFLIDTYCRKSVMKAKEEAAKIVRERNIESPCVVQFGLGSDCQRYFIV